MVKVLCLDGGGIRGLYTLEILKLLENKIGNINEYFDIIVGTSTGSIIATLIRFNYSIEEIKKIYMNSYYKIIENPYGDGLFKPQFKNDDFENIIDNIFKDKVLNKNLIITSVNLSKQIPALFHFNENNNNLEKIKHAVISSCSAPILFKPHKIGSEYFTDGGIILNNPSLVGFTEANKIVNGDISKIKLLSIGTMYEINSSNEIYNKEIVENILKEKIENYIKSFAENDSSLSFLGSFKSFLTNKFENKITSTILNSIEIEDGALLSYVMPYLSTIIRASSINVNNILKHLFNSVKSNDNFLRINLGVDDKLSLTEFKDEYYELIEKEKNNINDNFDNFINAKEKISEKDTLIEKQNKKIKYLNYSLILCIIIILILTIINLN